MRLNISPSLMCMQLKNFTSDIKFLDQKVESYHIDIMDGSYVKNITLSPWFVEQVRSISKTKLSVHLMVNHPEDFVTTCLNAGSDIICLHTDTIEKQAFRLINMIKDRDCKVGVVLNPATSVSVLHPYIHLLDKVTVMTVDPGFAGQKFVVEAIKNIALLADMKKNHNYKYQIEVDGSCNKNTWEILHSAGTEVFITGTSGLFNLDNNIELAWKKMEDEIQQVIG